MNSYCMLDFHFHPFVRLYWPRISYFISTAALFLLFIVFYLLVATGTSILMSVQTGQTIKTL